MNKSVLKERIPEAIDELHQQGEPAAYYNEIVRRVLGSDEQYVSRRLKLVSALSKVGLRVPIIPAYPLLPRTRKVYSALSDLESEGAIESYFQLEGEDGNPPRRVYRMAKDTSRTE